MLHQDFACEDANEAPMCEKAGDIFRSIFNSHSLSTRKEKKRKKRFQPTRHSTTDCHISGVTDLCVYLERTTRKEQGGSTAFLESIINPTALDTHCVNIVYK